MIPAVGRLPDIREMIDGKYYFILHSPRQSGKTTYLTSLTEQINSEGKYFALNCALHSLRVTDDYLLAMDLVVAEINASLRQSGVDELKRLAYSFNSEIYMSDHNTKLRLMLNDICCSLDRELVVFFDEADCLMEKPLIMFLSQIREGFIRRDLSVATKFPMSMALVGIRDIQDYLSKVRPAWESKGPGSPFNVRRGSLKLEDFTFEEVKSLYGQHTADTGQVFEHGAIETAWRLSEGQPWLVNALADDVIIRRFKNDFSKVITAVDIKRSSNDIILRKDAHFESLIDRLREPRVRKVVEHVIIGTGSFPRTISQDDIQYVINLGILKKDPDKNVSYRASNPIYGELIFRAMSWDIQRSIPETFENQWMDGKRLDMEGLLKAFQVYWRENSEASEKAETKENEMEDVVHDKIEKILVNHQIPNKSGISEDIVKVIKEHRTGFTSEDIPHLALNAFLQRVLNGGADDIKRECALRRTKVDICVTYKSIRYPIELKIKRGNNIDNSLEQLFGYMDKCGASEGWLIIFDMNFMKLWKEKIFWNTVDYKGLTMHVVGC
jgi:hypothetical protein